MATPNSPPNAKLVVNPTKVIETDTDRYSFNIFIEVTFGLINFYIETPHILGVDTKRQSDKDEK